MVIVTSLARWAKKLLKQTDLSELTDPEVLALHRRAHEGAVELTDSQGGIIVVKRGGFEEHESVAEEMQRRGLLHLPDFPFTSRLSKASEQTIREQIQAALVDRFGQSRYPYLASLESVPAQGSCIVYVGDGEYYRAQYDCSETGCTLSGMEPVEQEWVEKAEVSTRSWGSVDKTKLPRSCFLVADSENRSEWKLPVYEGAGELDAEGRYSRRGRLNANAVRAALAAVAGARSGKPMAVSEAVKGRLQRLAEQAGVDVQKSGASEITLPFSVRKADERGNIYGLAAIADDEAIAKWQEAGGDKASAPAVVDTQGDWMSEATLLEMAEGYLAKGDPTIGLQHEQTIKEAQLLQSAVLTRGARWPEADSPRIEVAKAWAFAVHVDDEEIKKAAREGKLTGLSIGGRGMRVEA